MAHHVLYIPGIGDHRPLGQNIGIGWWRLLGVRPHYRPIGWADGEDFEPKLQRLIAEIDMYLGRGHKVSLLGFSAGASAALNAFAERKSALNAVVCIAGKINHPGGASAYFARNPALGQSLDRLQPLLRTFSDADKARLMTMHPKQDRIVSRSDAVIAGVRQKQMSVNSHVMAIVAGLTMYAPFIVHRFKKLKR